MHTTIGSRLKVWRDSLHLKQTDAAGHLGLPPNTYQNYERDVRAPNTEGWEAFAKAGINTNWLLTGQGPMLLTELAPKLAVREPAADFRVAPAINIEALAAIIEGALKAMPSASKEQIARHSVEFYVRCIEDGLITPDGVGSGNNDAAA